MSFNPSIAPSTKKKGSQVNSHNYLVRSIRRLCLFADIPNTTDRAQVREMLAEFGFALHPDQRAVLERYCR